MRCWASQQGLLPQSQVSCICCCTHSILNNQSAEGCSASRRVHAPGIQLLELANITQFPLCSLVFLMTISVLFSGCLQQRKTQIAQQPDLTTETALVVRAVCATKLPTLTFQDVARFRGLIADTFPGTLYHHRAA